MKSDDSNSTSESGAELVAIGQLLVQALTRLDAAGRFDVSVHVDFALHQLRGTRHAFDALQSDIAQ
jgi:hypothetical protein